MKLRKPALGSLGRKRIIIPTVAAVAVLGAGGIAVASTVGNDDLRGTTLDRASAAALDVAGDGVVTDADASGDRGVAYEVDVTREDGTEVEVYLDSEYQVVRTDEEGRDDSRDDRDDDRSGSSSDDLTGDVREQASAAALTEAGAGVVTDADASDDQGVAYEVDVTREDGTRVEVYLDEAYQVVRTDEEGLDDDRGDRDSDDRVLSDTETQRAQEAALAAVGGGIVTKTEADDDGVEVYEVEVVTDDGREWIVTLDADFGVVEQDLDD